MLADGGSKLLAPRQLLVTELGLQTGMRYADLGCGSAAHFVFPASEYVGDEGKVYALDIQKPILEAIGARARGESILTIETVWTDLEVYGAAKAIENDSIDRLSMINVLFQTNEDEHVFNEANRMLKPGGKALVVDWLPTGAAFGPPPEKRTSLDEVRRLATIVGWKEVRVFDPGQYHFGVVFEK